jgi:hypothetical protein
MSDHLQMVPYAGIEHPGWTKVIWRYMGIDKFLDLIINSRLFFTEVGRLPDQYEGTVPAANTDRWKAELARQGVTGEQYSQALREDRKRTEELRRTALVSCWSMGTGESYALWRVYLGGARAGVAVRTSVYRVKRAIEIPANTYPPYVYLGSVSYTGYIDDVLMHPFRIITTKIPAYRYEHELRLFFKEDPEAGEDQEFVGRAPGGLFLPVDLGTLIDKIYVSPFAGGWFRDVLIKTLRSIRPELEASVEVSGINEVPGV